MLDASALLAVERDDRAMAARLRAAEQHGLDLRSNAMVVAEVWRDPVGRQARLARLLRAIDVRPVDERLGRDAGVLVGRALTDNPIDATVVLVAEPGDRIVTSDGDDIAHLAAVAALRVVVVRC